MAGHRLEGHIVRLLSSLAAARNVVSVALAVKEVVEL